MRSKINTQGHPFHLVDPSPWPFTGALGALTATIGAAMYMHNYFFAVYPMFLGLFLVIITSVDWWGNVVYEAVFEGHHTKEVQRGLRQGMLLFIVSEMMLFFSFFWAFLHSGVNPAYSIGQWPPAGIEVISPWGVPLLNTTLLLTSGATVTLAHHALVAGDFRRTLEGLLLTVLLSCFFICVQLFEYKESSFTISDGVFASGFFLTTGFHGFHVVIGTLCLFVCLLRLCLQQFTREHHVGLECAIWYWHFVDVVWFILFLLVYWWPFSP
jgi:heme/copper-type cytochrome/quinol oxidase subunit 3